MILETAVGRARVGCDAVGCDAVGCDAVGCDAVGWQGQAQACPALRLGWTLRAEPGHKQSIRTVCAWRRPEHLALAHAREEEQRGQRAAAWLNRVRSALTQRVKLAVKKKVNVHAVYPAEESSQLPFLGSVMHRQKDPL